MFRLARPIQPPLLALCTSLSLLSACSSLPSSGPGRQPIDDTAQISAGALQFIEVDQRIAQRLRAQQQPAQFSAALGAERAVDPGISAGDALEITLWEAPPATLFSGGLADLRGVPSTSRATQLPEQVVDREGLIQVPFAGRIPVAGKSPQAVAAEIVRRLSGKANQPEALVRVIRPGSALVTVVGEVQTSIRMPITPAGERLLDALAAAGGVRQPVGKTTLQVTRGDRFVAMPLDRVIRDPSQNVPLRPGDVVTALFQPLSFTALGGTGKNEEISFETQGITLAQAIARAGGLTDTRADAQGVYVFRLEPLSALDWPHQPTVTTPDGQVPTVYRLDLRNPGSFFVMQHFMMRNHDVLYVSNAPLVEVQKFLNIALSAFYPLLSLIQVTR